MAECIRGWLKDVGPFTVSVAVVLVTISFNFWQRRLAKQQLRHQLYDRRMVVYGAFRDLLLALPEKGDDEIKALVRRASIARFEVAFLFEGNLKLQTYLDQLCKRVNDEVLKNIVSLDTLKQAGITSGLEIVQDIRKRATQLGAAKLEIPGEHLERLPQEFAPFLKLTDFSTR
jgi:hypothetical protein